MTALIIIGAILLILSALAVILFLPLKVFVSFKEEFFVKIKFIGIKLFEIPEKEDKKETEIKGENKKSEEKSNESETLKKAKQIFADLKEKHGTTEAVKKILQLLRNMLSHIKPYLRYIKIKKIVFNLTVATGDAASTAIEYGKICSAVYPVLAFLDTYKGVYFKKINVGTDFNSDKTVFNFSLQVRVPLIFLIIMAFKIISDYKIFIEENNDERK